MIVQKITRHTGVAGQVAYSATVQYPDEPVSVVTFVGDAYSGPVVMVSPTGVQTFVTEPARFGPYFNRAWVRRFFEEIPS